CLRMPTALDRKILDLPAQRIDFERLPELEENRRDALDGLAAFARDLDDVERRTEHRNGGESRRERFGNVHALPFLDVDVVVGAAGRRQHTRQRGAKLGDARRIARDYARNIERDAAMIEQPARQVAQKIPYLEQRIDLHRL